MVSYKALNTKVKEYLSVTHKVMSSFNTIQIVSVSNEIQKTAILLHE